MYNTKCKWKRNGIINSFLGPFHTSIGMFIIYYVWSVAAVCYNFVPFWKCHSWVQLLSFHLYYCFHIQLTYDRRHNNHLVFLHFLTDVSDFGCDLILARGKRNCHLLNCPANVIMCKAEWNRWPLYTIERRRHIPFRQINPRAKEGQLGKRVSL